MQDGQNAGDTLGIHAGFRGSMGDFYKSFSEFSDEGLILSDSWC